MSRLVIFLKEQESSALCTLAESEYRDPQAQAAIIIREELVRRGLLQSPQPAIHHRTKIQNHKDSQSKEGG